MKKRQLITESANHIRVREAARLDDFQEVSRVSHIPTSDAADTLEAVHDVAVDAKCVARLGNRCVVRLHQQDIIYHTKQTESPRRDDRICYRARTDEK